MQHARSQRRTLAALLLTVAAAIGCGDTAQRSWVISLPTTPAIVGPPQSVGLVSASIAWWSPDSVAVLDEVETNVAIISLIDGGRRRIGRKGAGPREFRSVYEIKLGDSVVFVNDPVAASLVVLSRAGAEVGRVGTFGSSLSLLPWSGDTAALVLYQTPGTPSQLLLVAETDSGWAIVQQRAVAKPASEEGCPSQKGPRSSVELPLAAATRGFVLSLDPFSLGGSESAWKDSTRSPLAPLCPPLGPMTSAQRARALDMRNPAYIGLKPNDLKAIRSSVDAYSRVLQPIIVPGRFSRGPDGRWWAPLELQGRPSALIGISGTQPARIEIPDQVIAVDWQTGRRDSMIGVVLVRDEDEELFLRRISAPIVPLPVTRP